MRTIRWRITYVATACDSSMPKTAVEFYANDDIEVAAGVARVPVSAQERDGGAILSIVRT